LIHDHDFDAPQVRRATVFLRRVFSLLTYRGTLYLLSNISRMSYIHVLAKLCYKCSSNFVCHTFYCSQNLPKIRRGKL
jgi:hypothetical protein